MSAARSRLPAIRWPIATNAWSRTHSRLYCQMLESIRPVADVAAASWNWLARPSRSGSGSEKARCAAFAQRSRAAAATDTGSALNSTRSVPGKNR